MHCDNNHTPRLTDRKPIEENTFKEKEMNPTEYLTGHYWGFDPGKAQRLATQSQKGTGRRVLTKETGGSHLMRLT